MFKSIVLAAAWAAASLSPVANAAETWVFDKAHTQVLFTVNHLGFTDLTGQFRGIEGELKLDRETIANSSVVAVIRADSVDMNHEGINKHLRNADFFNVESFPELRFESTSVEAAGESGLSVAGNLTMLGQTRPVTLAVTINQIGAHPMSGKPHAGFTATGSLKRSDWGMAYLAGPVGDEIAIRINIEADPAAE